MQNVKAVVSSIAEADKEITEERVTYEKRASLINQMDPQIEMNQNEPPVQIIDDVNINTMRK